MSAASSSPSRRGRIRAAPRPTSPSAPCVHAPVTSPESASDKGRESCRCTVRTTSVGGGSADIGGHSTYPAKHVVRRPKAQARAVRGGLWPTCSVTPSSFRAYSEPHEASTHLPDPLTGGCRLCPDRTLEEHPVLLLGSRRRDSGALRRHRAGPERG